MHGGPRLAAEAIKVDARTAGMVADSGRILIVEDDAAVLYGLQALVGGWGFEVYITQSGTGALEAVVSESPDLMLLDLVMPGTDGIEVCRRLREWSTLPVLVVSARGEEAQKVAALESGADDYITKPFSPAELRARIRTTLRRERRRQEDAPLVTTGGLTVDLATRRVRVGGVETHLTPNEYELLRVLVTNPDRVLTHRYLLRCILGAACEDALESLRTYIKQLRRKVEPDPTRPRLIVNEPGVGYRFVPDV